MVEPHTEPARSRKERDRLLREEDFLTAAERLFSEKGYFETSMEDVARAAEYATGTIYRYFGSKEELYHQLLLRKGRAYYASIVEEMAKASTTLEKVQALIRGKLHFFFANRDFMRIYLHHLARPAPGARCQPPDELKDLHEGYRRQIRELLAEGMAAGALRPANVELTLAAMTGLTNELVMTSLEEDFASTEDEMMEFVMDFLNRGMSPEEGRAQ